MAALAIAGVLAGCGGKEAPEAVYHGDDPLPNGMTVKQQIEARQHNMKDLGGAFKAVNDQLKLPEPQLEAIRLAAQEIRNHAQEVANWFPAGTGPESGVKTDATAKIWTDQPGFTAVAATFNTEAGKLADLTVADDLAAIGAQAQIAGAACKACHDAYRMKKE
jgi:cytochrome c556